MPEIISVVARNSVISRLEKDEAKEVSEIIKKVNERLTNAKDLPVRFALEEFGSTNKIRADVERRIKTSGWSVIVKDQKWEVQ